MPIASVHILICGWITDLQINAYFILSNLWSEPVGEGGKEKGELGSDLTLPPYPDSPEEISSQI
jgi:hypothetical protein